MENNESYDMHCNTKRQIRKSQQTSLISFNQMPTFRRSIKGFEQSNRRHGSHLLRPPLFISGPFSGPFCWNIYFQISGTVFYTSIERKAPSDGENPRVGGTLAAAGGGGGGRMSPSHEPPPVFLLVSSLFLYFIFSSSFPILK